MISSMMMIPAFEPTSFPWSFHTSNADVQEDPSSSSISWSDIPCQGDFWRIDFQPSSCSPKEAATPQSSSALFDRKHDAYLASPPPSPRSLSEELLCELNTYPELTAPPKSSNTLTKTVRFAEVAQIRTYDVILGDHPSCRGGMALQLDWSHGGTELVHFEMYEEASRHRSMGQLHLSFFHRRERLRNLTGMSGCELLRAEYELLFSSNNNNSNQDDAVSQNVLRRSSRSL